MPEVRDLSDALPDLPMDPITGVGVVASRNRAPTGYDVAAQTADGLDADLWKDGLFKSKVTRYLCFTRSFSKENSHLGNVLVDMKLIDIKDTLPVGFIPIQETIDTQEIAFRKKRLCIKFIPRDSTEAAICDIRILGRSKQAPPQYTFIGELNNMGIWYRMGRVPRNHESSQPATPPSQVPSSTPAPNLPRHISLTLPASFRGKSHSTRLDLEHQHSNLYAISAMDGVPFMISEKFACAPEGMQPVDLLGITIKTLAEIEKEFDGAGNLLPGKPGCILVSVSLPGAWGGDSHQTEGGLLFLREHFGTCKTWAAWCRGAACIARAASQLKSQTRRKMVSAAHASSGTIGHKHLLLLKC
ncbi:multivesicular body subunit 12B isoform X2 [Harpia harpyja]|nr:multivesicular body subunit 12B isoform X2 [Harpia harpyja]XP_052670217.1 multivesicular body subunit 12B isoform X2 [Harpia harpyja]XP_052670218.1 multivesicular body subunit 12B isoform X2 [Harpia harpyja]XP_052670219.1 multivesicular body subunit 12B isoform X2 [Harpia harpyja]XP_052670220.1 multivesicular body subunit 12B isoform X2 [Harpia harpyja]XP_052670221.1 multivesicular body subunit 12B isoform X2 [Harpia harpyja]XP_052670222.1 multivesicular body subunit 12B isoform X2 [Harpia